ncbi:hypothetical protein KRR38_13010 [Novosphingobium sp. G106]|uniref:DUF6429 family protein n=1 Tax=Novosphingobium sp. G106 TaxID=2849500 RepID=UPI001C2D8358|nr:DUF6429 family protein [Novosphingobium sp. G106]MBV1688507.1 hypothetical protein [Novosphingobium sp. G106]MBV1688570.1 hypothetical protein [Novosphingobium sp. G106]
MAEPEMDTELIDEAVLALLFLTLHKDRTSEPLWRAWKSFDWDAMARLHAKELIFDPVGQAKSVVLTQEGRRRCEEAYYRLFARRDRQA